MGLGVIVGLYGENDYILGLYRGYKGYIGVYTIMGFYRV